jgi:hypothetical protein
MSIELFQKRNERRYSTVIFSKAYDKKDIAIAARMKARGTTLIFDLCDNHFMMPSERVTRLLAMYRLTDFHVVSSAALAEVVRVQVGGDKPLRVIEDAVEETLRGNPLDFLGRFRASRDLARLQRQLDRLDGQDRLRLVWFGNHKGSQKESGIIFLQRKRSLLETLHARSSLSLTVISNSRARFRELLADWAFPTHYLEWNAKSFFAALKLHDVAVIPNELNPFTRVKTNNRIALALNLGLGVVADRLPSYEVFSDCAFLDDWDRGLQRYIDDPSLRAAPARPARPNNA